MHHQPGTRTPHNLVADTLKLLDLMCGSTRGSIGLFRDITSNNWQLIEQTLITLTEYCQGPCRENQASVYGSDITNDFVQDTIVQHENRGLNIVISLILNDIQPLSDTVLRCRVLFNATLSRLQDSTAALQLKSEASKLLLAVMESRDDSENAQHVLNNMSQTSRETRNNWPQQLVSARDICSLLFLSRSMQSQRRSSRRRVQDKCLATVHKTLRVQILLEIR